MEKPDITIIMCTYNEAEMLSKALNCLFMQECEGKFSYDVLVVDDGSTDQTNDILEEIASKSRANIKCVHTQGRGISHARNRGVAESQGKWIAFFDQDQLAEPGWLFELFDVASKYRADIVEGPRDLLLSPKELSKLGSVCRAILGERTAGSEWSGRTCSCTGNVLINRKVFDVIGGFDESIIQGGEDWEFFGRVKAAGFDIHCAPKALVHHMIPDRRLTEHFFKWNSLRAGASFAVRDYKDWGLIKTILVWIARMVQALMVNIPLLLCACLVSDDVNKFGQKCLIWRAVGYTRRTMFIISPRLFTQTRFLAELEFRKERCLLQKVGSANLGQRENT